MPESTVHPKKSIVKEYQHANEKASSEPLDKTPCLIGKVEDFDLEEISQYPKRCSIFVEYDNVYAISFPLLPHERISYEFGYLILHELRSKVPSVVPSGGADIWVANLKYCGQKFIKQPDQSFSFLNNQTFRLDPFLAIEVGFSHENLDLLLRQAEVLLNECTQVVYVLLIDVQGTATRIESIRIVLCQRTTEVPYFDSLESKLKIMHDKVAEFKQCDSKSKFGPRRLPVRSGRRVLDLESNFDLNILFDQTFYRDGEFDSFEFTLQIAQRIEGTVLEARNFPNEVIIRFPAFLIDSILNEHWQNQ